MGNSIPVTMQVALALSSGKQDEANMILTRAVNEMTGKLMDLTREYSSADLPVVAAAMKLHLATVESCLTQEGKNLEDRIIGKTMAIAVNLSELQKQMEEEGGSE